MRRISVPRPPESPVAVSGSGDIDRDRLAFGEKLRSLRVAGGLTAREMSARTGWPPSRVSKIENGLQTPRATDVDAWVAALGGEITAQLSRLQDELTDLRAAAVATRLHHREVGRRALDDAIASARTVNMVDCGSVPSFATAPLDTSADVSVLLGEAGVAMALEETDRPDELLEKLTSAALASGITRVGLLPLRHGLAFSPKAPYWIIDDAVHVAYRDRSVVLSDASSVDVYRSVTDQLWTAARTGDDAVALLRRIAGRGGLRDGD